MKRSLWPRPRGPMATNLLRPALLLNVFGLVRNAVDSP